jgi:hypothetical protein
MKLFEVFAVICMVTVILFLGVDSSERASRNIIYHNLKSSLISKQDSLIIRQRDLLEKQMKLIRTFQHYTNTCAVELGELKESLEED